MLTRFKVDEDTALTEEYRKNLIECFVNSVYVYEDKLIITYNLLQKEKAELFSIEQALNSSTLISYGGGEENRTPVRKALTKVFSERSLSFRIPPAQRR